MNCFCITVLSAAALLCAAACSAGKHSANKGDEAKVQAEMFIKSKSPQEGFIYHEAEGKQFYIKPVTEQTFYPGEDSYNLMHHHGVAFESELMAYRIYFDKKQTVDVYAKRTPGLELAACKWYPTDEQLAQGFGDDVLRVSGTIGAGSCKPYYDGKMQHFDDVAARKQRIVENGPQRIVCEMEDSLWLAPDGRRYNITTRYTLYAGHRDVQVDVYLSVPEPISMPDSLPQLCTGVQKVGKDCHLGTFYSTRIHKTVTSWGTDFPVNDTIKYARETVGLAVCVLWPYAGRVTSDKRNSLILLKPQPVPENSYAILDSPYPNNVFHARYYLTVVAQKENDPPCTDTEGFTNFVKNWIITLLL